MNKRSYVISGLIIVGMLYILAIGPGGAIRSGMGRIAVLADDWPICSDAPFEIVNAPTTGGDMQWNRTYGGSERDEATALIQTTDGGFTLVCSTQRARGSDMWLVKIESTDITLPIVTVANPNNVGVETHLSVNDFENAQIDGSVEHGSLDPGY